MPKLPKADIGIPRRRPGAYTHVLTLQQRAETAQNSYGEYSDGWSNVSTHYCSLEPISGMERVTETQTEPERKFAIETWYVSGVVPKMRWLESSRGFEIVEIVNAREADTVLRMICVERDA